MRWIRVNPEESVFIRVQKYRVSVPKQATGGASRLEACSTIPTSMVVTVAVTGAAVTETVSVTVTNTDTDTGTDAG